MLNSADNLTFKCTSSNATLLRAPHFDNADARSLTLLRALSGNMNLGDLPHPIRARNLGLYQVWQQWSAWKGGDIARFAELLTSPQARFEQCIDFLDSALKADPAWDRIRQNTPAMDQTPSPLIAMGMAPLMFLAAPHALIEPTNGLQQLLANSDLGDDIPLGFLRPPASANYIRFGPTLRQAITPSPPSVDLGQVEGVYVFESTRGSQRALAIVPIYGYSGQAATGFYAIDLVVMDEDKPLLVAIQSTCNRSPELAAHFQSIAQMCTKVLLYLSLAQAQRDDENAYTALILQLKRVGPKKAAKLQRQSERIYDRIVLGPQVLIANSNGELSPHWRRGHFRMQRHGVQNSLRKVLFIAPTLVRADRLQEQT